MSQATVIGRTRQEPESTSLCLFDVLHNSLVLANIVPHLDASGILNLAAADQASRALVYNTPGVFRHLDLTRVKNAQFDIDQIDRGGNIWRNAQLDENLSEDDFYSGPLRAVFSTLRRRHILQHVQTLVLDGLSVTSELCHEIINDASFSVRILSIRDVKNLNQSKLRGALQYACRRTRPENSPKLRALYIFGSRDPSDTAPNAGQYHCASVSVDWNHRSQMALTSSLRPDGDAWWSKRGRIISRLISDEWASCMVACEGIIAFDAVLCQGPRHRNSHAFGKTSFPADSGPAAATFAVSGCENCGTAPEGLAHPASTSPASLPLLAPPPILSSSIRAATSPQLPHQPFVARCMDCLRERYCIACHKWWCEACYKLPGQVQADISSVIVVDDEDDSLPALESLELVQTATKIKSRISKSCWECGNNCDSCIDQTQRVCRKCCGGYCIIHNEGSSASHCDWCVSRGRGLGRL
ncbi:ubiquitin fusion degradation protein (Ufd1) [Hirsutella rhossiliensis]|uniref:Ubiquitin fusion degradation protein (Ufd1) n=1 Tax=Hirsutella rhossiliensis TaxID=111463 RepID=A0A9P8MSN4_9HYPO|nr:ubiquitin fusion degradation protein (Ufd1) [Hirsutella rhossiliensis]KAH0961453.1 ubiquitin fusion degradation protein (Ufd1) [Hirsutella rhossiliensis]